MTESLPLCKQHRMLTGVEDGNSFCRSLPPFGAGKSVGNGSTVWRKENAIPLSNAHIGLRTSHGLPVKTGGLPLEFEGFAG